MKAKLGEILDLVGNLDDSKGENTPRERFREYIKKNITEVGKLRDYIQECLRLSETQYNRAFQDLVNQLGMLLGFEVVFGRYSGVKGEIGFDGHWKSPDDFHIVVEVKSSETYPIKTDVLLGYINQLISENKIPSDREVLGLYVIGKPDPEVKQLKNAIIAEGRTQNLRIISIDSLLSLAELMSVYDVNHGDILSIIKPSAPYIDSTVDIMTKLSSQNILIDEEVEKEDDELDEDVEKDESEINYWITPVKDDEYATAQETIINILDKRKIYAFGERTPGRKKIKSGDMICFYETGNGIIAHAEVRSKPIYEPNEAVKNPDLYPYTFKVANVQLYLNQPVIIDESLRRELDAFKDKDPSKIWAWFVQSTRQITKSDFEKLTK